MDTHSNAFEETFEYLSTYQVFVCKLCKYAVRLDHLRAHISSHHAKLPGLRTYKQISSLVASLRLQYEVLDPNLQPLKIPPPDSPALPHLELRSGLQCIECTYICCTRHGMGKHVGQSHPQLRRPRGWQPRSSSEEGSASQRWRKVFCQRFFATGKGTTYFRVAEPMDELKRILEKLPVATKVLTEKEAIRAELYRQLKEHDEEMEKMLQRTPDDTVGTEVSPWLQVTRWPKYLRGQDFAQVASLGIGAQYGAEPLLVEFSRSVVRVIEKANISIENDVVNMLDQERINSFIQRRRLSDKPLFGKLQTATWKQYTSIWQRLICFAYRSSRLDQPIRLSHCMTVAQRSRLERMEEYGNRLLDLKEKVLADGWDKDSEKANSDLQRQLDRWCLLFSIALLDHTLKGDLFESTIVGFLAVLGIDMQKQTFVEAPAYTSNLSGLIKVGQVLVIQRAVMGAEDGEADHPADLLDEMRDRFMIHGSRSPFNWALRLRAYGKAIRNNTTSLGYICWSEDKERLSYRATEFGMGDFKAFIKTETELIYRQLEDLLLVNQEEKMEEVVPKLNLRRIKDVPKENARGWSFLKDERNGTELPDGSRWLLKRMLDNNWLRDEFVRAVKEDGKMVWRTEAVDIYLAKVDRFLERLLLLVHITSGQPSRATETLSLRHENTVEGGHRNVFIEDGLVSTVTSYHKGYSVTGSTKIIHRYLPNEIGEVLVYYLWLIRPFVRNLRRLGLREQVPHNPFVWAKDESSWDSSRLRAILKSEAKRHLKTELNVRIYRHVAIAISRQHLPSSGFRRDYDLEEKCSDGQASHASWTAGIVYARGLEEAPGHVEERKTAYRAISREWHSFLGFGTYLPERKRPLDEVCNEAGRGRKRQKGLGI